MSEPTSRESLLRVANLVRPALATQAYIPILTNIYFDGASAMAYNDISAIAVRCNVDLDCCLPGELLIKALNSLSATEVLTTQDKSTVVLAAGRSKLKLPCLPSQDFPESMKSSNTVTAMVVEVTDQLLRGIAMCLTAVSNDPTHPAQMGVTLEAGDQGTVLYSTDNITLSRYQTKGERIKLPGDIPIILPTFFCQQLLTLGVAFPTEPIDLLIFDGALMAKFGEEAELFTKLVVDLEPLDIGRMIGRYVGHSGRSAVAIPDGFDSALDRALLVLANETDKATKIAASGGRMTLFSKSDLGEADDSLGYTLDAKEFLADPALLSRGAKSATKIELLDRVVLFSGDEDRFTHLVAHCAV